MTAYEMRISDWSSDVCSSDLAVAVKGNPKVQFFFRDKGLQIGQVLFFGRVGMMVGEIAVHFGEKQMMLTRQQLGELLDHGSGGAIAGIPTDTKGSAVKLLQQPLDIRDNDVDAFRDRSAYVPVAFGRKSEMGKAG